MIVTVEGTRTFITGNTRVDNFKETVIRKAKQYNLLFGYPSGEERNPDDVNIDNISFPVNLTLDHMYQMEMDNPWGMFFCDCGISDVEPSDGCYRGTKILETGEDTYKLQVNVWKPGGPSPEF